MLAAWAIPLPKLVPTDKIWLIKILSPKNPHLGASKSKNRIYRCNSKKKAHIIKYVPINLRPDQSCKKGNLIPCNFLLLSDLIFSSGWVKQDRWRKSAGGRSDSVLSGGSGPVKLMVVSCSAVSNFGARTTIRKSWGSEERSLPGVKVVLLVSKINSVKMVKVKLRSPKDVHQQVQEENIGTSFRRASLTLTGIWCWSHWLCCVLWLIYVRVN